MSETKKQAMISLDDLFRKSFAIYKPKFWKLMGMNFLPALLAIPAVILIVIAFIIVAYNQDLEILSIFLGVVAALFLIATLALSFLTNIGTILIVSNKDNKLGIVAALKKSLLFGWRFLGLVILSFFLISVSFLVLIIPGIVVATYLFFVGWVLVLENRGVWESVKRSKDLVKGYWWQVFGRNVLIFVIILIVTSWPNVIFGSENGGGDIAGSISDIISIVVGPFSLAYSYYMYKSLAKINSSHKPS